MWMKIKSVKGVMIVYWIKENQAIYVSFDHIVIIDRRIQFVARVYFSSVHQSGFLFWSHCLLS